MSVFVLGFSLSLSSSSSFCMHRTKNLRLLAVHAQAKESRPLSPSLHPHRLSRDCLSTWFVIHEKARREQPQASPTQPQPQPLTPYLTSVSVSVSVSVPVASSTLYGIGYSSAPKVVKKMPSTLVDSQNSFSCRALVHNKAGLHLSFSHSLSELGIEWVSRWSELFS